MGYRQYIYKFDKSLVKQIRSCRTEKGFIDLIMKENPAAVEYYPEDDTAFVELWDLGDLLFEFGKYYENSNEMYKHGDSLFQCDELNAAYEDFQAIVLDPDGLKSALDWQRDHIIEMYEDLLREKSANEWDSRPQLDRLISHAKDYLYWWKSGNGPGNLRPGSNSLVSSWLYEHTYFDLVRIYKTFDWENSSMIFMGW